MAHCKECVNSIFKEQFGEYRCSKTKRTIYNPTAQAGVCVEDGNFKKKKEK